MMRGKLIQLLRTSTSQKKFIVSRRFSSKAKIISSPYPDVILPQSLLHNFIFQDINKWPNHTAIECAVSGKRYTYSELHKSCKRFATSLKKFGLQKGDNIAIMLPNTPYFPVAFLGALEAGLGVSTVNPAYTKDEVLRQLSDCNTNWLVCHPINLPVVLQIKNQMPELNVICTRDLENNQPKCENKIIHLDDLIGDSIEALDWQSDTNPSETAVVFYSSGTTGLPKGTCLTHNSITANLTQMHSEYLKKLIETHGDYQDTTLAVLPFFHCYGNVVILLQSLRLGAKIITFPNFDPKHFIRSLETNKNIMLWLVPPLVFFLGNSNEITEKQLRGVREIMNGAAPCSAHDLAKLNKKNNKILVSQGYGMTETSPVITCYQPTPAENNKSTIGKLLPNTSAKVISLENGEVLSHNETGELLFKGPQIMKGYLNNPKATAETIDSEGWIHTGDVGHYAEDGFFYITERLKELIKVKGFQVAPAELEEVLRKHPAILEAGVVGAPHERMGEVPVAFAQIVPGSKITEGEIKEFVASQLSKHKHLSSVKFIPSIPKTASGKILRKQLKTMV